MYILAAWKLYFCFTPTSFPAVNCSNFHLFILYCIFKNAPTHFQIVGCATLSATLSVYANPLCHPSTKLSVLGIVVNYDVYNAVPYTLLDIMVYYTVGVFV